MAKKFTGKPPRYGGIFLTPERIAILEALLEIQIAKVRDIGQKTNINYGTIHNIINKERALVWAGLVEKTEWGSYRIVPSKREAVERLVASWYGVFPKPERKKEGVNKDVRY